MSRIPALPVAVAVAITAPVAAIATVVIQRMSHRKPPHPVLVANFGIRNVPDRPPLWRTVAAAPVVPLSRVAAAPVPPENPHAPATPAYGIRQVR